MSLERRTPLKRTGFKRKAPTNTDRKPRTPLRQRSVKRQVHMTEERIPAVKAAIEAGRTCEVCPVLAEADIPVSCSGRIEGLHERRKSSSGGSRSNPENLIPACNWSNGYVEDQPLITRALTGTQLVVREGDPEWEALSAREWRKR